LDFTLGVRESHRIDLKKDKNMIRFMFPNISLADLWKLIVGVKKVVREEQREH
jgi:hypothetical protein